MRHNRITIAHLVLVVMVAAIGLAAIRSGSAAWAGAMFSITFFAMICSVLGVVLGRGMRRIYWSGFATLGWGYLLLMYAPWLEDKVGKFLLAPNLFESLDELLHPEPQAGGGLQSLPLEFIGALATGGAFGGGSRVEQLSDFIRIGVAMEALLWAFLGGWVACYFASARDRDGVTQGAGPAGAPGHEAEVVATGVGPPVS